MFAATALNLVCFKIVVILACAGIVDHKIHKLKINFLFLWQTRCIHKIRAIAQPLIYENEFYQRIRCFLAFVISVSLIN